jgi:hypothetical protein
MTVHRINGCKLDLAKLSDDALFERAEMIGRNMDQLSRELELVNNELTRRCLARSFDPAPAS